MTSEIAKNELWVPGRQTEPPRTIPLAARIPWAAVGSIATLSVGAAYTLAYLRKYAFAAYFEIPRDLITIEPSLVLAAAVPVFVVLMILIWLGGATLAWASRRPEKKLRLVILLMV